MFIEEIEDLFKSVTEYNSKPEFWKASLGSSPKYFLHFKQNDSHYFGLSKFCVFKDICVEEYIESYRYKTDGGTAQKMISKIVKKKWIPKDQVDAEIQNEFTNWVQDFFPNYNPNNANFITLIFNENIYKKPKGITPDELRMMLDYQSQIGLLGENIAYQYELERLKKMNINNPVSNITKMYDINVSAGYDIHTETKNETRFIEVKSSVNNVDNFFLSENEFKSLEMLRDKAYIYLVKITNFEQACGHVEQVLQNPIEYLRNNNFLKPIAYKVKIKSNKLR